MFLEFSSAFSIDFGRRRKSQLPDGFEVEEIDLEAETEDSAPKNPGFKLGFQKNEEKCDCEECA